MRKLLTVIQIAFTYIGTVVGAGFATGQEILQFYTRYGGFAAVAILFSSVLFIWIGTKLMLLSHELNAQSYEDLNRMLFGERFGSYLSVFTMVVLFGVTTIMLAGAGSLFAEQFNFSYQSGLLLTLIAAYLVLTKGMNGILAINSVVVPFMMAFSIVIVWVTWNDPHAGNWIHLESNLSSWRLWFSPILYTAFNLAMAQAVLVPLGSAISDRSVLYWGGIAGGIGIGLMLMAGHFALSAQMPGIGQHEIPMGHIVHTLGRTVQLLFSAVIFSEIFTTFIADAYGLTLQLQQRTNWPQNRIIPAILLASFLISQLGFSNLLSTLYPLFGGVSLLWFLMLLGRRGGHPANPS